MSTLTSSKEEPSPLCLPEGLPESKPQKPLPPIIWACDPELKAQYLLKKDELAADNRSYLLYHPELRALLSDFLQTVLLRKPRNLIPFAQQYFESFLKFRPESHQASIVSSSSLALSVRQDREWDEWNGEDNNDLMYYPIRPTRTDDGLEKVSSEDLIGNADGDDDANPEEEVSLGADGKYVTN